MFDDDYISLESISARLNLSVKYLQQKVKVGQIPFLTVGKRKRFRESAVREALAKIERQATEEKHQRKAILGGAL